jgi:hypothetical protein
MGWLTPEISNACESFHIIYIHNYVFIVCLRFANEIVQSFGVLFCAAQA